VGSLDVDTGAGGLVGHEVYSWSTPVVGTEPMIYKKLMTDNMVWYQVLGDLVRGGQRRLG